MQRFDYRRETSAESAARVLGAALSEGGFFAPGGPHTPARQRAQLIAGGTNMTDYMTLDVVQPQLLLDINALAAAHSQIEANADGLRLGALVRMAQAEDHPTIRADYPVIYETLQLAASRQIRNMASLGGNVLQRTRCEYFRERSWACNKRAPGSGCAAMEGFNRQHAILGTSDRCIAAYPGDFAQALVALDATVETVSASGPRRFAFEKMHLWPASTPERETTLAADEVIVGFEIPAGPWCRRSHYVKVRDRESYQFALASSAVALHMDGDTVREARIALGGVATVPWRAREAEQLLNGKVLDVTLAERAAAAAFAGAKVRAHNAFKVALGKQTLVRALMEAQAMEVRT
jgi:xanthine dehydrogenase YagS FAD-binding subunit